MHLDSQPTQRDGTGSRSGRHRPFTPRGRRERELREIERIRQYVARGPFARSGHEPAATEVAAAT